MIIDTIKSNFKIIFFGFIFLFGSSVGQSFFIGLFNFEIRNELNITNGQFGTIYGLATLCSSVLLIWIGKKIDDFKLIHYSLFVVIFLALSALIFSFIKGIVFLFIGLFLLRMSGQGLMSHTSTTAISRYFEKRRGKALSIVFLGMSLGEFILPVLIVYLLSFIYWRDLWIIISVIIILVLPLICFFTVKNISILSREYNEENKNDNFISIKSWTRREVLKDYRFYTILPCLLASPFVITGLVIYQSFILESKNWGDYVIAKAFMSYSFFTVVTLFLSGFLVDKFSSRKLLFYLNIPMIVSLFVIVFSDHSFSAFIFMGLLGITNGLANVIISSLWAEIYGVNYLGSIKALTGSLIVFSTAFATAVFGILIDYGHSIENISIFCLIYTVISTALILFFRNSYKPIAIK